MKVYTKLMVVMFCQIIDRKSVAPSSSNFWRQPASQQACWQDEEIFFFSKQVDTLLPQRGGRVGGYPREVSISSVVFCFNCLAGRGGARGSTTINLTLFFWFVFKISFYWNIMETCGQQKKLRPDLRYYWDFSFKNKTVFECLGPNSH